MNKVLIVLMLLCPIVFGQDLAKNDNKKAEEKKAVVTSAELDAKEVEEGRKILADTRSAAGLSTGRQFA